MARSERRAGRPVKYDSAGAHALFVPFAATDDETLATVLLAMETTNRERFTRSLAVTLAEHDATGAASWGCLVDADAEGVFRYRLRQEGADARNALLDPHGPPFYSVWRALRLRRDEAKELQARLDALAEQLADAVGSLEVRLSSDDLAVLSTRA